MAEPSAPPENPPPPPPPSIDDPPPPSPPSGSPPPPTQPSIDDPPPPSSAAPENSPPLPSAAPENPSPPPSAAPENPLPPSSGTPHSPSPPLLFDPSRMIGIIRRKALIKDLAAVYHAECLAYCQELLELQRKCEEALILFHEENNVLGDEYHIAATFSRKTSRGFKERDDEGHEKTEEIPLGIIVDADRCVDAFGVYRIPSAAQEIS
ncbi:hypothetical protein RJ639_028646 [Escallonia herrerae]|uniref:Uncharacterized protein n=1 Tax=Escallonia herrerae TaxID=1293975 RepID=A0AA88X746_9ASTE|nr:hypothetical protein RJ639_028646 [Escallonia herrerae]